MLHNLAEIYRHQKRYEQAERLYERSIVLRDQLAGPDTPEVATVFNDLGSLYLDSDRLDESVAAHERALAIRRKVLGDGHPSVAVTLNNMAAVKIKTSRVRRCSRSRNTSCCDLGEDTRAKSHEYRAGTIQPGSVLLRCRRFCFGRVSSAAKHSYSGKRRPRARASRRFVKELATLFVVQGKYSGAEKLLHRALAIREAVERISTPESAAIRQSLADVFRLQRRYAEARKVLLR